jgi:thiamine biosynthesis lipoprotein
MSGLEEARPSRRESLTRAEARGADELASEIEIPRAADTLRIQTQAMACHFAVFLDAQRREQLDSVSEVLESVHGLEALMSVYRSESPMSRANATAAKQDAVLEETLFEVVALACRIAEETDGAFDPTTGPLVELWQKARESGQVPDEGEVRRVRELGGLDDVAVDVPSRSIRYGRGGVELNLGGIGKGFALDRIGAQLLAKGVEEFLLHGGHSSVLARGGHAEHAGWPVGIRNPLFPTRRLATLLLCQQALSTSGSGIESYRIGGRRFSDILDPRTGWPAEGMLSVTVLAETAAEADALSTAFFVGGVEFAEACCDNRPGVAALLIPAPHRGQTLEPIVCGIPEEVLFFEEQAGTPR